MKRSINKKGFFLIEILVGMAIMLIVLAAAVPLYANTVFSIRNETFTSHMLQEGRWALDLMARDIALATAIVTPSKDSSATTLTFQRADTTGNITYSLVNQEMCRQIGASTKYPLTDGNLAQITSVTFQSGLNGENVTINLTLTNGSQTVLLTRTVFLLNK